MPVYVSGRALGVASNGVFTSRNTDPIPGGSLWPEAAATWKAMRAAAIADGIEPWEFTPAGPNSSARGRPAQLYFWTHQPPPAARPYTSNHGWAIAVDVRTRRAAAWIMAHGHRFGWSHDEGLRVGEWWHMRYVGLSKTAFRSVTRKFDPLRGLDHHERELVEKLHYHRHGMAVEAHTGKGPRWHKHHGWVRWYEYEIHERMAEIRVNAHKPGGGGWARYKRGRRYQILKHVLEGTL